MPHKTEHSQLPQFLASVNISNHLNGCITLEPEKLCRIELSKEAINFSAAHFTIFSRTEREDLHGHNFQVIGEALAPVDLNGLVFDYAVLKKALKQLCDDLDEKTILPEKSPYLSIEKDSQYVTGIFDNQKLMFLHRDVITLPIANVSVEELSHYFLKKLMELPEIKNKDIREVVIKISSSPGQAGTAIWRTP